MPGFVRIAAFDFDGTLLDTQSGMRFILFLMDKDILPHHASLFFVWWGVRYKLRLPHGQHGVREYIYARLSHLSEAEQKALFTEFHDKELLPRYKPEALAEVQRLKEKGYFILMVSATFSNIIEAAQETIGYDDYVATTMGKDLDGLFTGKVDSRVVEGAGKPRSIIEYADSVWGKDGWELAHAFGDHQSDIEMLECAIFPHVVDPGPSMLVTAIKRKWNVIHFR